LPKGKLDDGETPRAAAKREVLEETGHDVSVHEFLGTLVHESGGRSKVVHYWRMVAHGGQVHALMDDVNAVDWLPLDAAVERLSRADERVFLANVGPLALEMVAASGRKARPLVAGDAVEAGAARAAMESGASTGISQADAAAPALSPGSEDDETAGAGQGRYGNLVQKVRDWLRREVA
jgi:8-oxo-dGTP diphosphatase